MPEICEVAITSQYLQSTIGDSITKIKVLSGRYTRNPINGIDILEYPLKINLIRTKGKFMWFELSHNDNTYFMLNTFGLTGKWSFDALEHCTVRFTISNNMNSYHLYFCDVRGFGTISFTNNKKILMDKINKLAPDMLQEPLTESEFIHIVHKFKYPKKNIVSVLMAQDNRSGFVCGLGNYLVAEILYRAKISPHRSISLLSDIDISTIYNTIRKTLKLCYVSNNTEYIDHIDKTKINIRDYLTDVKIGNEKFKFKVYKRKYDDYNNSVVGEKIIQSRTTYWVPEIQS